MRVAHFACNSHFLCRLNRQHCSHLTITFLPFMIYNPLVAFSTR